MTRHRTFLALLAAEAAVLACLAASSAWELGHRSGLVDANRRIASALRLTDLSLWTEARYTRHPSQADRFAAFQDLPGALEHFPAGSLLAPPPGVRP